MRHSKAFTFVEMIITLAVAAALLFVLLPKFGGIFNQATQSTVNSAAAALNAASAKNYMLAQAGATHVAIDNCTDLSQTLPASSSLPSHLSIDSLTIAANTSAVCTVRDAHKTTLSATFTGWGTT